MQKGKTAETAGWAYLVPQMSHLLLIAIKWNKVLFSFPVFRINTNYYLQLSISDKIFMT